MAVPVGPEPTIIDATGRQGAPVFRGARLAAILGLSTVAVFALTSSPSWATVASVVLALMFASYPRLPIGVCLASVTVSTWLSPVVGLAALCRLGVQLGASVQQARSLRGLRAAARRSETAWREHQVISRDWAKEHELQAPLTLSHDDFVIDGFIFAVLRGWVGMRMVTEIAAWLRWTLLRLGVGAGARAARQRADSEAAEAPEPLAEAIDGSLGTRLLMRPMFFEWALSTALLCIGLAIVAVQVPRWERWHPGDVFFAAPYLLGLITCWYAFRAGQRRRGAGGIFRGYQLIVAIVLAGVGHLSALHALVIPFACGYGVSTLQRYKDSRLDRRLPSERASSRNMIGPRHPRLFALFLRSRRRTDDALLRTRRAHESLAARAPSSRPTLAAWAQARLAQADLLEGNVESGRLRLAEAEALLTDDLSVPSAAHAEVAVTQGRLSLLAGDNAAALARLHAAASMFADLAAWHAAAVTDHEMVLAYARLGDADGAERVAARSRDVLARYFDIAYLAEDGAAIARVYRQGGQATMASQITKRILEFIQPLMEARRLVEQIFPSLLALVIEDARSAAALADHDATRMFDEISGMLEDHDERVPELLRADAELGHAGVLLGSDTGRALTFAASGLGRLERIRGAVRASQYRGGMLVSLQSLYREGISVLAAAAEQGDQTAGRALLAALESLKRDGLAQLLRSGGFALEDAMRIHLEALLDLDNAQALASPSATRTHEHAREVADAARAQRLGELAAGLSAAFASAIDPDPVDANELLDRLAHRNTLMLYVESANDLQWTGMSIWVTPTRSIVTKRWRLTPGEPTAEAFAIVRSLARADDSILWEQATSGWQRLGELLLPQQLSRMVDLSTEIDDLVIVPSPELAALPFAALRPRGRALVECCRPVIVPSISVLADDSTAEVQPGDAVLFLSAQLRADDEAAAWREQARFAVDVAADGRAFIERLRDSDRAAVAYVAAHGSAEGTGLGHRIDLDGVELSAAAALGLRWPDTVVLASCWVSRIELKAGYEPFGLPVSCMLQGARVVIGGVAPVSDETAGRIMRRVIEGLASGVSAAEALRRAQAEHITSFPDAVAGEWAAYHVMAR